MWKVIVNSYNSLGLKEKHWVRFVIAIVLGLTLLPLIIGLISAPDRQFYTNLGFVGGSDKMVYFSQIEEAKEGHILLRNLFTSEPQKPSVISPLWLALGIVARITALPTVFIFHIARLILGYLFLWLLYLFLTKVFLEVKWRKIAFLVLCFGSGLGVFTVGRDWSENYLYEHLGSDIWVSEGNTFLTLAHSPLFILSQLLILLIFWWTIERFETAKYKEALAMGLAVAFLGILHPYDLFIIFSVTGGWFLFKSFKNRQWFKSRLKIAITICLAAGIAPVYFYWLKLANPAFAGWLIQNETLSPRLFNYLLGYGLIFILYFSAIFKTIKSGDKYLFFLSLWSVINWFLLFIPIQFQRRLANGFHLTLTIIAVFGLERLAGYLTKKNIFRFKFLKLSLIQIFIVLLVSSTVFFLGAETILILWDRYAIYLPQENYQAMVWLKSNVSDDEVILSSAPTGNVIPAYTGRKVYLGHGHQTNNWREKLNFVNNIFFNTNNFDGQKFKWLKNQKIDYLFFGFYEKKISKFNPFEKDYLKLVWQQGQAAIFKVK